MSTEIAVADSGSEAPEIEFDAFETFDSLRAKGVDPTTLLIFPPEAVQSDNEEIQRLTKLVEDNKPITEEEKARLRKLRYEIAQKQPFSVLRSYLSDYIAKDLAAAKEKFLAGVSEGMRGTDVTSSANGYLYEPLREFTVGMDLRTQSSHLLHDVQAVVAEKCAFEKEANRREYENFVRIEDVQAVVGASRTCDFFAYSKYRVRKKGVDEYDRDDNGKKIKKSKRTVQKCVIERRVPVSLTPNEDGQIVYGEWESVSSVRFPEMQVYSSFLMPGGTYFPTPVSSALRTDQLNRGLSEKAQNMLSMRGVSEPTAASHLLELTSLMDVRCLNVHKFFPLLAIRACHAFYEAQLLTCLHNNETFGICDMGVLETYWNRMGLEGSNFEKAVKAGTPVREAASAVWDALNSERFDIFRGLMEKGGNKLRYTNSTVIHRTSSEKRYAMPVIRISHRALPFADKWFIEKHGIPRSDSDVFPPLPIPFSDRAREVMLKYGIEDDDGSDATLAKMEYQDWYDWICYLGAKELCDDLLNNQKAYDKWNRKRMKGPLKWRMRVSSSSFPIYSAGKVIRDAEGNVTIQKPELLTSLWGAAPWIGYNATVSPAVSIFLAGVDGVSEDRKGNIAGRVMCRELTLITQGQPLAREVVQRTIRTYRERPVYEGAVQWSADKRPIAGSVDMLAIRDESKRTRIDVSKVATIMDKHRENGLEGLPAAPAIEDKPSDDVLDAALREAEREAVPMDEEEDDDDDEDEDAPAPMPVKRATGKRKRAKA